MTDLATSRLEEAFACCVCSISNESLMIHAEKQEWGWSVGFQQRLGGWFVSELDLH